MGGILQGGFGTKSGFAADGIAVSKGAESHARRVRTLAWVLLGVLAAAYFVVLNAPLAAAVRLVVLESIYCTPILLTVVLSIRSRLLSEGAERAFWGFLATANAILLGCELLLMWWVFVIDPSGPPRVSWPFHIMHGVAAICFIGLILSMSRFPQASSASRLRWTFDSLALALVAGAVLLAFYVRPVMGPAGAPVAETLLGVGYPLFGLLMIVGTMGNVVGMKVDRWRAWDKLTAVSLTIYALAISLWPFWYATATATSRNYERGLLDLVQFGGHWLLLLAAVYRLTELRALPLRPLPPPAASRFRWAMAVVPVITIAAIPVLAWSAYSALPSREWFAVYAGTATAVTLLVLCRSVVVALEHGALFHRSITDPLTGLYNHRFFHDRLGVEIAQATRYGEQLAVVVLDLDDFGLYNDRYGHMAGDRLLTEVGSLLRGTCPTPCTVARLGGDEFAALLPNYDALDAKVLARRMLDVLTIEAGSEPGTVSVSAGVSVFPVHAFDAERLLRVADGALFDAKESGKSTVVVYDDTRVPDLNARERIDRLERQNRLAAVRALAAAVDARDPATQDHSRNVARLTASIAAAIGLPESESRRLEIASLVFDVGKIGVSDAVLNKREPLTDAEWQQVRHHVVLGQQILASAGLDELLPIMRSHHEWWDGSGYPDGLAAEEITLEARIVAVCDAYDAMVSDRPYRSAMSSGAALAQMIERAGTQFDPDLVSALQSVVGDGAAASGVTVRS